MYIHPIIVGAVGTLILEFGVMLMMAFIIQRRRGK